MDLITLQEHLKEKDVPPEVSSMEYARELLEGAVTSANVKYYAEIVKDKAVLRRLIRINESIANTCYLENKQLKNRFSSWLNGGIPRNTCRSATWCSTPST